MFAKICQDSRLMGYGKKRIDGEKCINPSHVDVARAGRRCINARQPDLYIRSTNCPVDYYHPPSEVRSAPQILLPTV